MPECIHGLEAPQCDACYPKAAPEKPRPAARAPRATAPRIGTVNSSRRTISIADQRAYHVTHISNLEAILETGELRAGEPPRVDVSSPLTRELRASAEVAPGESVGAFVPFYLVPAATLWEDLRDGAQDETRWSSAARAAASTDFIFLVTTVASLGEGSVIADGDAAGTYTRFAAGEQRGTMLQRLHDSEQALAAEVLGRGPIPFSAIQLVGVANERVRDRVRALTTTRVAVYPPWFVQV